MRRALATLGFCALFACGIGVVGSGPTPTVDAGPPEASAPVDAPVDTTDRDSAALSACLATCPQPHGTCSFDGVCTINCNQANACRGAPVKCPDNVPCVVVCSVKDACNDVQCGANSTCAVTCTGTDSCHNVTCTAGAVDQTPARIRSCTIDCEGTNACEDVKALADMVHITCNGTSACNKVRCGNGSCLLDGNDHVDDSKCCNTQICTGFENKGMDCFP